MRPLMVELCAGTGTMAAAFRALEPGAHQMADGDGRKPQTRAPLGWGQAGSTSGAGEKST